MRPADRERRLAALERAAAQRERDVTEEHLRAVMAALSRDEIDALAAECLIQHGADPATALEVWRESHRVPGGRGDNWSALAAVEGEVMRLYLADLKHTARLGLSEMRRNPGPRRAALAAVAAAGAGRSARRSRVPPFGFRAREGGVRP